MKRQMTLKEIANSVSVPEGCHIECDFINENISLKTADGACIWERPVASFHVHLDDTTGKNDPHH